MLSQRMGFHYGDNVSLPEEGEYTARVRVGPLEATAAGAFDGRFESASSMCSRIEFTYSRSDIHDLEFELLADDRRGTRDALSLVDHRADHENGGSGHEHGKETPRAPASASASRPIEDLPGERLGSERTADAAHSILEVERSDLENDRSKLDRSGDFEGGTRLVVCLRTPYNDVALPFAALEATVERDGDAVVTERLEETLDPELGHHYGVDIDPLEAGDLVTVVVDAPPQVSRHDGYETAFLEFEDVTVTR